MPRANRPAYAALLVTAALWGSNAVVARGLLDVVSPAQLAFARWLVVLACLLPLAWTERHAIAHALREDLRPIAALGLLGFGPQTLLTYTALAHTTAVVVGLLNSAIPVLIVAIAAVAYARRPRLLEGAGLGVSLAGVLAIVAKGNLAALQAMRFDGADLLAFGAMFVWALYTLRLTSARPRTLSLPAFTFVAALLGEAMLAPVTLADVALHGLAPLGPRELAGIAYIGVLPSLAATLLWTFGVARLGAVRAGVFTHLVPLFAALFAVAFLGESLRAYHAAGFLLIAGGALLCCMAPVPMLSSQPPRPADAAAHS